MSTTTANLGLFKYNTTTDANVSFNINTALNDNWDKIDAAVKGGSSRNLGEIIASTIPLTDAGLHLLDGSLIQGDGIYSDFVDYIAGLYGDGTNVPSYFTDETSWQSSVTTYGVCGKFVYNSTNNTVRLPKVTGILEGTTDLTALGDLVEAGLPNITGSFSGNRFGIGGSTYGSYHTGAFLAGTNYSLSGWYGSGIDSGITQVMKLNMDASLSNPIYGNSTTVQPQTIKAFYYIVIATSTKTNIQVDIDEIVTDLNGKVSTGDLAEVQCVIETYSNGTSWYRVYSDGWCEQGGIVSVNYNNSTASVTLLKKYINTNYNILFSEGGHSDGGVVTPSWQDKTTSEFIIWGDYSHSTVTANTYWQACGYII